MSLDNLFEWMFATEEIESLRSSMWSNLRRDFLEQHPECQICGNSQNLQVHHFFDVSTYPELELKWNNLVTLCTKSKYHKNLNCHLVYGHLGNWKRTNYHLKQQLPMLQYLLYRGINDEIWERIKKYETMQNNKNRL